MPAILAFKGLKQKDHDFEASPIEGLFLIVYFLFKNANTAKFFIAI